MALGRRAESRVRFERLRPRLEELAAATGESVSLGTRIGDEVLIVVHVDSAQPLRFDQAPGTHVPVHASGIGKALLAFSEDPAAEVAALGELLPFTESTLTSPTRWLADLRVTRHRGWALNDGERHVGVRTMAAALLDVDGRPWAGVAVQGPSVRLPDAGAGGGRRVARDCRRDARRSTVDSADDVVRVAPRRAQRGAPAPAAGPSRHRRVRRRARRINALAESSPGFVWRLVDESGQSSSYVRADDDPLFIINLSVWETPEQLHDFVFQTAHTPFLRRRREWFERMAEAFLVCWWVPAGHRPTVDEAMDRLDRLRRDGVTDDAFTLRERRPTPGTPDVEIDQGREAANR